MRVAVFSKTIISEVRQLCDALARRGHRVDRVALTDVRIELFSGSHWKEALAAYDLVYYRNGLGDAGRALLGDELRRLDSVLINPGLYHPLCSDKAYQAALVTRRGVPVPATCIGRRASFEEVRSSLGTPFVAKSVCGIQGKQVRKIQSEAEYEAFRSEVSDDLLFQEVIPNTGDFRVFVVGDEVRGLYKRVPPAGAFLSNISQGGTGERVSDQRLCRELSEMACTAAAALELDVTGIDIIQSSEDGSLYFLEANGTPGWKGLNATLGIDMAERVADYFERRVDKRAMVHP